MYEASIRRAMRPSDQLFQLWQVGEIFRMGPFNIGHEGRAELIWHVGARRPGRGVRGKKTTRITLGCVKTVIHSAAITAAAFGSLLLFVICLFVICASIRRFGHRLFERATNDARSGGFFEPTHLRVASRYVTGDQVSRRKDERYVAVSQSVRDRESRFTS